MPSTCNIFFVFSDIIAKYALLIALKICMVRYRHILFPLLLFIYSTGLTAGIIGGAKHNKWDGVGNAMKIFAGQYYIDENASFWKGVSQGYSRHTEEAFQTNLGLWWSELRNMNGNVDRVDYLGGATFVTQENKSSRWGVTLGSYINIQYDGSIGNTSFDSFVTSTGLYMHEYGHTIDSRKYGSSYMKDIGIPSFKSAIFYSICFSTSEALNVDNPYNHNEFWTEKKANRNASAYFGKYYDVDWSIFEEDYPTK